MNTVTFVLDPWLWMRLQAEEAGAGSAELPGVGTMSGAGTSSQHSRGFTKTNSLPIPDPGLLLLCSEALGVKRSGRTTFPRPYVVGHNSAAACCLVLGFECGETLRRMGPMAISQE